jgi:hypothetical protein
MQYQWLIPNKKVLVFRAWQNLTKSVTFLPIIVILQNCGNDRWEGGGFGSEIERGFNGKEKGWLRDHGQKWRLAKAWPEWLLRSGDSLLAHGF